MSYSFIRSFDKPAEDLDSLYEKYSENNRAFLNYMKQADSFDPYNSWFYVCKWCERNDYMDEVSEAAGEEVSDADEMMEHEPELFYKLDKSVQETIAEWATSKHMADDPADAPTGAHMSLNKTRLLPRTTWLVHFTDDPYSIYREGFTKGMDQMDRLGLTTWFGTEAKKYGGYNFAFEADSRYADWAAHKGLYGTAGVMMFQNSGVHCHHYGDEEDQVVFWGADVDPRDIVLITKEDGDWCVKSNRDLGGEREDNLFKGTFENAVKWVKTNHRQYAKMLFRR